MAAMFGRKKPKFEYVQVRPGELGTVSDAFDSFTYWIPSDALQRRLLKQATEIGRGGEPDPTAVVIAELDEINAFRELTRQAAFNCGQAAGQLFAKDQAEIRKLVSVLLGPNTSESQPEVTAQVRQARLQVLSGHIVDLEAALNSRLDTIASHYNSVRNDFMGGVYAAHPYGKELRTRGWSIEKFQISDRMRDFGQAEARALISKTT